LTTIVLFAQLACPTN